MLEILKAKDENFNGSYKINTADAYRGAPVYISGKSGSDWYVNLPATSAQAKLFAGIVNQYPMIQTGSDTADATDKLVKGSRVVVLTGECEIKVNGGCVHQPTWSKYWLGDNLATAAQYIATAFWRNAYIGAKTGYVGKWVGTSAFTYTGFAATAIVAWTTAAAYFGSKVKVLELVGSTSTGIYLRLDVNPYRSEMTFNGAIL